MRTLTLAVAVFALAGCAGAGTGTPKDAPSPARPTTPAPGSDRDAHGCIPSAGYAWCAATNACERPWELAKARGLDNTAEAFDAFCTNPPGAHP